MSTPDETDLRAAEYVLGTLNADEREAYRRERAGSPALAAAERAWEARLAPLAGAVPEVAPPPDAWDHIAARLPADSPRPAAPVDLRPALRRWRRTALAAGALAAGLALFIAVERLAPRPDAARYLAVVNRGGELPALVVRVDPGAGTVEVRALAAEVPRDRSLELWVVPASGTPRSLGLVRDEAGTRLSLPARDRALLDGASLAVTLEPPGGSPSGAPTGPAVYSGRLVRE
ncbi:anti-sigma factor [Methylobacterium nonmethylotrophicum]|uniref:Anti-sigma K factor RskA C-terminal domain-containing protein n=1 Tax=Methylobacterium nonmethylotrophicum TaxID=1141884 RepID=A0A4Z0NI14_9HYPH|nr:anti-sigma factor [Methylobacterium nonmethylotrophicum]TGD95870.1 hypothetical protein EU555_26055 [Methylobacterium nonmethylotrophicum]